MERIVIHRKEHPSGWQRWFEYRGRAWAVTYEGPGWGYQIMDILTSTDAVDGLHTLAEVREEAPDACHNWLVERRFLDLEAAGRCGCCAEDRKGSRTAFCDRCYSADCTMTHPRHDDVIEPTGLLREGATDPAAAAINS